jgi:hypothetical protein
MTSQSPRIYIYKITFEEVLYYYYGVHKEKKFNEYYMGSPVTHKWMWDFYTPKKQILEFFEYTDEGWIEAQEVETRLIRPFYQTDKWCLNESCGGIISLKVCRNSGEKCKELGLGFFTLSTEQRRMNVKKTQENKRGIFGLTENERRKNCSKGGKIGGKISGKSHKENQIGIFGLTIEEKKDNGSKGGKISGKMNKELKRGYFALSKEELGNAGKLGSKNTNSQRWECCETGYVSTAAGVVAYQKGKGIDTSKTNRRRIS